LGGVDKAHKKTLKEKMRALNQKAPLCGASLLPACFSQRLKDAAFYRRTVAAQARRSGGLFLTPPKTSGVS
jgi:hypothetical protein